MTGASDQDEEAYKGVSRHGLLRLAALKSSLLPLVHIRESNRQSFKDILHQTSATKLIFFDKTLIRPLGTLIDGAELKQWGVSTCVELDDTTVDTLKLLQNLQETSSTPILNPDTLAFVFVSRPTTVSAALIADKIKYQEKLRSKGRHYILSIIPRVTEEFMSFFSNELGSEFEYLFSTDRLKIYSCPIYLFPLDSDLISLELYGVVRNFHSQGDPSDLILSSEAFIQLQSFLKGLCPNIRVVGNAAKFVCDQIIRVRRELQMQLPLPWGCEKIPPPQHTPEPHKNFLSLFENDPYSTQPVTPPLAEPLRTLSSLAVHDGPPDLDEKIPQCLASNLPEKYWPHINPSCSRVAHLHDECHPSKSVTTLDSYSRYATHVDDSIFLDRRVDFFTPLCTSFTYEALLDETLGIQQTFLSTHHPRGPSTSSKPMSKTRTLLISSDPVFADIRHLPQHLVGSVLHDKASDVQKTYKEKESLTSISEINAFMKKFKIKQAEHLSISNHVNLLGMICATIKTEEFQRVLQLEDDIMSFSSLSNTAALEILPSITDLCDNETTPYKTYRLMCLLSLVNDGLKPQWIEEIVMNLCRTFGIQELSRLHFLEKAGLFKVSQSVNSKNYWNDIKTKLKLIVEETKSTGSSTLVPNDISYVCSGYAPLSVRLIEELYKKPVGWTKLSTVFNMLWGPTLEFKQKCLLVDRMKPECFFKSKMNDGVYCDFPREDTTEENDEKAEDQDQEDQEQEDQEQEKEREKNCRVSLVFFLGGCTYGELTALRYLNKSRKFKNKRQFVVVTTEMLNYKVLFDSFSVVCYPTLPDQSIVDKRLKQLSALYTHGMKNELIQSSIDKADKNIKENVLEPYDARENSSDPDGREADSLNDNNVSPKEELSSYEANLEVKKKSTFEPLSIRSTVLGSSTGIKKDAGVPHHRPPNFKFTPNVNVSSSCLNRVQGAGGLMKSSSASHINTGVSLTHSLLLRQVAQASGQSRPLDYSSALTRTTSFKKEEKIMSDYLKREYDVWSNQQVLSSSVKPEDDGVLKKQKKKSLRLQDLDQHMMNSFSSFYAPITLPLWKSHEKTSCSPTSPTQPTFNHIDDSNRYAADIFNELNDSDSQGTCNRHFLFVQFPSLLPPLDKYATASQHQENIQPTNTQPASETPGAHCCCRLEGLPEGLLGTLQIHKSGRVVLRIGDHKFNVNQGSQCSFAQEVAWLIPTTHELMFLGECTHRVVVSPDLDQLE